MTTATASPTSLQNRSRRTMSAFGRVIVPILSKPAGFIGFAGVLFFVLLAYLGPVFVPSPATNLDQIRQPPSAQNPFGTDNQGKSVLIQVIRGGREVISTGAIASVVTAIIGVAFGSLAAYLGGFVDRILSGIADFILTIPSLPLLIVLSTVIRFSDITLLAFVLAAISWPVLMRSVRSQVLSLRERDYIEAAVSLGLPLRHIIINEILPNMASYIIVNVIFVFTNAIYNLIGLVFLGFVPLNARDPNWGLIINNANKAQAAYQGETLLWVLAPVLAIALLQWFLITLARAIEDTFNPRLKSGG
jgi:peptide/nickel transport system permease protein